jgi:hypothetical protein
MPSCRSPMTCRVVSSASESVSMKRALVVAGGGECVDEFVDVIGHCGGVLCGR